MSFGPAVQPRVSQTLVWLPRNAAVVGHRWDLEQVPVEVSDKSKGAGQEQRVPDLFCQIGFACQATREGCCQLPNPVVPGWICSQE